MSAILYLLVTGIVMAWVRRRVRITRGAAIALVLLPLCLTGRAMLTGGVYGPVDLAYVVEPLASLASQVGVERVVNPGVSDVYAQFFPWNDALRRVLGDGEWPLWNRYEFAGGPLAAALQVAPYHPITILGLLMPIEDAITFSAALMFFLAALSTYLFVRELVASDVAALIAAAGVMLSTHLVWYAGTALAYAAAAAPLTLLGARRIVHAPGVRSAALLGAGLLLIVQAGHPESALHHVVLAVAYFLFELVSVRPKQWRAVIVSGAAAGIVALLLSAIFLLPFFEAVTETAEYRHRQLTWSGNQRIAAPPELIHRLRANTMPFLEGLPGLEEAEHEQPVMHGWLANGYAGSLLFAAAIFALLRARSRTTWFFVGAGIFGLGAGTMAPGVTHLLSITPGFRFAVNDRMIFFATIGVCVLAAIGIDAWMRTRDRLLPVLCAVLAALMTIAAVTVHSGLARDFVVVHALRAIVPLLLAAAALLTLPSRAAAIVFLALLLVQRTGDAGDLQATMARRTFYPPFPGLELMRAREPFRIVGVGVTLTPATSTHYGLEDIRGFQALTFGRFYDTWPMWCVEQPVYFNRVDSLEPPFLSMMNVRFAIAPSSYVPPAWWMTRGVFGEYAIHENTRVLPRAFVPRNVIHRNVGHNMAIDLPLVTDFADASFIETNEANRKVANGPGRVTVQRERSSGLHVRASMQNGGWVIVTNTAWKGWRAVSGGRELPLHYANGAFVAFHLPAGEHEVRLTFLPRGFVIGAWISAITVAALLLGVRWRSQRPRAAALPPHS